MTRLSATEVARSFSAIVNRVGAGEEIEVVRNGVPVATGRISTTGTPLRTTSISSPAPTRLTIAEKLRATSVALSRVIGRPYQINRTMPRIRPGGTAPRRISGVEPAGCGVYSQQNMASGASRTAVAREDGCILRLLARQCKQYVSASKRIQSCA